MNTNFKTIMKEKSRMCKMYETCQECFLNENMDKYNFQDCNEYMISDPELFLNDMNKWMDENPRKTNSDLFNYKFKNTPWSIKNEDGFIRCGYKTDCKELIPCNDCPWWFEPKDAEWDERKYEKIADEKDNTEEAVEVSNELNDIDNIETQNESNKITEDDTEDVVEIKDEDNESWSE